MDPNKMADNSYIVQWNCRGANANKYEILHFATKYDPIAINLQETLLTPTTQKSFNIPDYTPYLKVILIAIGEWLFL